MWEVITNGPIIILERIPQQTVVPNQDMEYVQRPKAKAEFTTEERKQDELDNLAKNIISGNVPDKHLTKLITYSITKEMWDTLESMCIESEEKKSSQSLVKSSTVSSYRKMKLSTKWS